jgi:pantetheine-phosphate adenylyltransferase
MTKALFGGRFNPISVGQMDVIRNASLLYDELIVLVHDVDLNREIVDQETRAKLVREVVKDKGLDNVKVVTLGTQTPNEFILKNDIHTVVRGLVNSDNVTTLEKRIAEKLHDIDETIDMHYVVVTQDVTGAAIRRKLRNQDTNLVDDEGRNLVPSVVENKVKKL